MKTISLILLSLCFPLAGIAKDSIRDDWREMYLAVLSEVVTHDGTSDRVYSVALARAEVAGTYLELPQDMRNELDSRLHARGVDSSFLIPASNVYTKFKKVSEGGEFLGLFDRKSGKPVWVYMITGVTWLGDEELLLAYEVYHGNLAAGGGSYRLKKSGGKWKLQKTDSSWVS